MTDLWRTALRAGWGAGLCGAAATAAATAIVAGALLGLWVPL